MWVLLFRDVGHNFGKIEEIFVITLVYRSCFWDLASVNVYVYTSQWPLDNTPPLLSQILNEWLLKRGD